MGQYWSGFFSFSSPGFPGGLRELQLQIKPPHFSIHQHRQHFIWTKPQTVPIKMLLFSSHLDRGPVTGLFPFTSTDKVCFGRRFWGILLTLKLRSFDPIKQRLEVKRFLNRSVAKFVKHRNSFNFSQKCHLGPLYFYRSLSALPKIMTLGEDGDKYRLKHWEFCLFR